LSGGPGGGPPAGQKKKLRTREKAVRKGKKNCLGKGKARLLCGMIGGHNRFPLQERENPLQDTRRLIMLGSIPETELGGMQRSFRTRIEGVLLSARVISFL